jgi:hypothetical protein
MSNNIWKIILVESEEESIAAQQKLIDAGYKPVGGGTDIFPGALTALFVENDPADGSWFGGMTPGSDLSFYEKITVEDAIGLIDRK